MTCVCGDCKPCRETARKLMRRAVSLGLLERPALCERCATAKAIDGHHPDYTQPLGVEWLCRPCHGREPFVLPAAAKAAHARVVRALGDWAQADAELRAAVVATRSHRGAGHPSITSCLEHGFSQGQVARMMGVSRQRVSEVLKIEKQRTAS